ncbi:hypothetical protein DOTSEDRAFT_49050 [Dothistroma septosporum NZE10]|uniref:Uncharacterized protein n=1 Tax=Dothistroma septosporum (strain NZE10 / CBS 128990) TaxID=675120 RepID=N1Q2E0_DOTSN|nr:hypothetical protein DOTSEDRAFT_49050 [Dothistroma septosporum NZE10]
MFRILTAVTLYFALASAQFDDETLDPAAVVAPENNGSASSSLSATGSVTIAPGGKLPPGAVATIPVTESSDTQLYVPTSTATPSSQDPASFTYAPDSATNYPPSSTVLYYAPETTSRTGYPYYSPPTSYTDGPLGPDVVRTESSDSSLAMPTSSSPNEYTYAPVPAQPTKPVDQTPPPPPAFTYAPETPYNTPAYTAPIVNTPSSKQDQYPAAPSSSGPKPYVAPIPASSSHAAPPAVNTPNAYNPASQSNAKTVTLSPMPYHPTTTPVATAPPSYTPSASYTESTVYVQPGPVSQPGTLTSKFMPFYTYSPSSTARCETIPTEKPSTYQHGMPKPTSSANVMTYKGHTISLGAATLAAEPTGAASGPGYGSSTTMGSMEGSGMRVGGSVWMCLSAAVAVAVGVAVV